jgi:CBS domain containing-hemolysin-like protein
MKLSFATLAHVPLMPGAGYARPDRRRHLSIDAPAVAVMTDLTEVWAVTVAPDVPIDGALEKMKSSGVRMLLVTDEGDQIVGLITSHDIQGERPIQLVHDGSLVRTQITVAQIMVPASAIEVLTMSRVSSARVGHVVVTLHEMGRQHALVVDVDEHTQEQTVRGVFSTSEIGKRLGRDVSDIMTGAHSLAELQQVIGSGT